jgi:DUF4097 and DUF4098 domain-containing protein YvlB
MPLHGFLTALLLALLALLAGNGCSEAQFTRSTDFARTHAFEAGRPFAVDWTSGRIDVRIDPSVSEITADGQLKARAGSTERARELHDQTKVEFVKVDGRIVLRLTTPKPVIGGNVSADVTIRLPAGVSMEIDSVNGAISVDGNTGPLSVDSTNGRIEITRQHGPTEVDSTNGEIQIESLAGSVHTSTTNGRVSIRATPAAEDRVRATSVNGAIDIRLPATVAATVKASTANGSVRFEPGEATIGNVDQKRNRLVAELNGGGCPIEAETTNGQISIACQRSGDADQ